VHAAAHGFWSTTHYAAPRLRKKSRRHAEGGRAGPRTTD
jgi:hypothetical protein